MVTIRFTLTEEEYFRFNYYTAWAAPSRKKYRISYFLRVILLYGAVALLYILANRAHNYWIDVAVFVFTGLVYMLFIPFFIRWSVRRRVKNILSKKENQHVLHEAEIILSNDGIIDKDTVSESKYDWDAIVHSAETGDSYYLYTNSYHAIVIPKRTVSGTEEQRELKRLLDTYLPLQI